MKIRVDVSHRILVALHTDVAEQIHIAKTSGSDDLWKKTMKEVRRYNRRMKKMGFHEFVYTVKKGEISVVTPPAKSTPAD